MTAGDLFPSHLLHVSSKTSPSRYCGHLGSVYLRAKALYEDSLGGIGFGALNVRIKTVKIRLRQFN